MREWLNRRSAIRSSTAVVFLIVAAFSQSCSELKYRIWAVSAIAEVTDLKRSSREDCRYVEFYVPDESGHPVKFHRTINMNERPLAVGDRVNVEYIPRAATNARLIEERSLVWPGVLLALVLVGAGWIIWVWRDFHANIR